MTERKGRFWLKIILAIFLIKGIFLTIFIPPWDAPDETSHMSYVLWLHNFKKLPSASRNFTFASIEDAFKESKRRLGDIKQEVTTIEKRELFDRESTNLIQGIVGVASYPPLYYFYLLPFYIFSMNFSSYFSLIFLRLGSLFLGTASLYLSYLLAKRIDKKLAKTAVVCVGILCLHPQFSFISSVINNDNLVVFFFLLFLYQSLNIWKNDVISAKKIFFLGLIAGLSGLVKHQLVICPPLFLLALWLNKRKIKKGWLFGVLISLVVPIWWYLRRSLIHDELIVTLFTSHIKNDFGFPLRYPLDFVLGKQPIGIFMSFWAYFGWIDIPLPEVSYFLFLLPVILSLIGWYLFVKDGLSPIKLWFKKSSNMFLTISFFLYVGVIFLYDILFYYLTGTFAINGRYFFPILTIILFFLTRGLYFYPKKLHRFLVFIVIGFFIIANFVAFFTLSQKYYGRNLPKRFLISTYKLNQ